MQSKFYSPKQSKITLKDGETGYLEGYGAVFGNVDLADEVILPGAFTKTIAEGIPANKIRLVDSHNAFMSSEYIIGKIETAEEDNYGLKFGAKFSAANRAQEVRTKISENILDSLSIGYDVIKFSEKDGVTYLEELKLYEISVVAWGCNPLAVVSDVKTSPEELYEKIVADLLELKEGRAISSATREKLEKMRSVLDDLLQEAGDNPEDEEGKAKEALEVISSLKQHIQAEQDRLTIKSLTQGFRA
jgi:uncharacterized protein